MSSAEIRKAAVVLMSLPQPQAAQLLAKLEPRQIDAVSTEIARGRRLTRDEQQSVILEFAEADSAPNAGGAKRWRIDKAHQKIALATKNIRREKVRRAAESLPFAFLQHVDTRALLSTIIHEHPQTIALIVSHLQHSRGDEIIALLPSLLQVTVLRRIAAMVPTAVDIVQEVEQALEQRLSQLVSRS